MSIEFGKPLTPTPTPIPGLVVWDLPVHGDTRGWFKENWQRQKMLPLGLPDFGPVQNNISFNDQVGTTRGIHAEPWDKYVSVATGRIFGAWVDLRQGPTFGAVYTTELDPSRAIFVPRGVGNAYQTLHPDTAYTYLVNDHWTPTAPYLPQPRRRNRRHPLAHPPPGRDLRQRPHPPTPGRRHPLPPRKTPITGANGQLRPRTSAPNTASTLDRIHHRHTLDLTHPDLPTARHWRDYDTIINAAAYTAVDTAETPPAAATWAANATAVAALARIATENNITLVHISSDYVYDGTKPTPYTETDPSPLNVYGHTKAAGDAITATVPRHYIIRTSWVIGDGHNFVRTMTTLAARGINPTVVDDQTGRPTFTTDLATGIHHLTRTHAPHGTYNLTNTGPPTTWADLARTIYHLTGHDPHRITPTTTHDYYANTPTPSPHDPPTASSTSPRSAPPDTPPPTTPRHSRRT